MSKIIYQPKGAAGEYSKFAANFYVGCLGENSCKYCYCPGVLRGYWPNSPVLKKSLIDESTAIEIFKKELKQNLSELQKHGLFFNFVSDPCLPETIELNYQAIIECEMNKIPVKILTKQTWWLSENFIEDISSLPENVAYGFTLTGHDELEPGAATNVERIEAMKKLHDAKFKTWGSFEPIIDFNATLEMIDWVKNDCDLFKIGLLSGAKHNFEDVRDFLEEVFELIPEKPIYLKDSILKDAGVSRDSIDLPDNCVNRDFNL